MSRTPRMSPAEFEELVNDAIDALPAEVWALLDNVVITVEPSDPHEPEILGVYDGTDLGNRGMDYTSALPDRIVIYRDPHLAEFSEDAELRRQVGITLKHEIAHYLGIEHERMHELGID